MKLKLRFPPIQMVMGLVRSVFTDPIVFTLAVGSALLGVLTKSVLAGLVTFFLVYSVQRVVLQIANAAGIGLGQVAMVLRHVLANLTGSDT